MKSCKNKSNIQDVKSRTYWSKHNDRTTDEKSNKISEVYYAEIGNAIEIFFEISVLLWWK